MSKPIQITHIGPEAAVPFVVDYMRRWKMPVDTEGIDNVIWWGAWDGPSLRGVLGLADIKEMKNSLFVYGFYGDGSRHETKALSALVIMLEDLPQQLYGHIYIPNLTMLRAALSRGWTLEKTSLQTGAHHVRRAERKVA